MTYYNFSNSIVSNGRFHCYNFETQKSKLIKKEQMKKILRMVGNVQMIPAAQVIQMLNFCGLFFRVICFMLAVKNYLSFSDEEIVCCVRDVKTFPLNEEPQIDIPARFPQDSKWFQGLQNKPLTEYTAGQLQSMKGQLQTKGDEYFNKAQDLESIHDQINEDIARIEQRG